ncbi:hypothetical protein [Parasphingorhabdus sp.]|uniref:hypothetical protein n=2 Tax=Parasphingorhabdus sp. TaxID=2709688 RepID=UPI003267D624
MIKMTATDEISKIGQIDPNSWYADKRSFWTPKIIAIAVSTIIARDADMIGEASFREKFTRSS